MIRSAQKLKVFRDRFEAQLEKNVNEFLTATRAEVEQLSLAVFDGEIVLGLTYRDIEATNAAIMAERGLE